ncbi:cytidylyltransferase domain-containing protein [Adlercreutzia sp. ZJ138]|uniref:cytidylyltransferase domain-containing protein n=1 Tax=Adlercreutzia sp. ZJ138 TaxID=2709405 RepID=UPI0013EDE523|nr:glycosyltransferase family protein [Adlercreutzia sp. ZJ138]
MNFLAVIQARTGSTRLPGKIMMDLAGKPQLQRVVERVCKSELVDHVMVATTDQEDDIAVVEFCNRIGVDVYAGSKDDVLDRYYRAALPFHPDYVVRVTGDCPCFDAALLDDAIRQMEPGFDYLGMLTESFPDGLDLEIIRFTALERSWEEARMSSQREHVTQYIVRNPDLFRLQNYESSIGYHGDERWTVDEPEDYELVRAIFEHFADEGRDDFGYADILSFLDANPELRALNARFSRNEGLAKSLNEDRIVGCSRQQSIKVSAGMLGVEEVD